METERSTGKTGPAVQDVVDCMNECEGHKLEEIENEFGFNSRAHQCCPTENFQYLPTVPT